MANSVSGGIIELDDKQFNLFREIIYREAGIKLSDMKKAIVQSRLLRRLRELHIFSYEDYYSFLQDNYSQEI
ncbi:MAG: SAM-dependent methyltransferase, partial [Spirochaetota bacterium]